MMCGLLRGLYSKIRDSELRYYLGGQVMAHPKSRGDFGDFGDFGVSFEATVAWRYTRWGGPRLSVQGEPLIVLTRGP